MQIELGLDTFGDSTLGADGKLKPQDQVLRDVVEQAVLADELGIHFIGIDEHHRADFAVSAPEIVLSALAARTARIRLGSDLRRQLDSAEIVNRTMFVAARKLPDFEPRNKAAVYRIDADQTSSRHNTNQRGVWL